MLVHVSQVTAEQAVPGQESMDGTKGRSSQIQGQTQRQVQVQVQLYID